MRNTLDQCSDKVRLAHKLFRRWDYTPLVAGKDLPLDNLKMNETLVDQYSIQLQNEYDFCLTEKTCDPSISNTSGLTEDLANPTPRGNGDVTPRPIPSVVSISGSEASTQEDSRCVRFSNVDVRFYERTMGDNPSVSSGPAVGIGWKFEEMEKKITLDEYEEHRLPFRCLSRDDLVLHRDERTKIVVDAGFSKKELATSIRQILKVKNQRKQTFHNLKYSGMEEMMEKTSRGAKKTFSLGFMGGSKGKRSPVRARQFPAAA